MAHITKEKMTKLLELLNSLEIRYELPVTYCEIDTDGLDIPDEKIFELKNKIDRFMIDVLVNSIYIKKKESPLDVLESAVTAPFRLLKSLF